MNEAGEAAAQRGYEFDGGENSIFQGLAQQMNFVAYATIFIGVLCLLNVLFADWLVVGTGVCYILVGVWTRSASKSFLKIVHTEGSDINHLMSAMTDLTKLYTLSKWALLIIFVVSFVAGFMEGMAEAATE